MNEWLTEGMNKCMNEQTNEWINKWTKEWIERMYIFINEWHEYRKFCLIDMTFLFVHIAENWGLYPRHTSEQQTADTGRDGTAPPIVTLSA